MGCDGADERGHVAVLLHTAQKGSKTFSEACSAPQLSIYFPSLLPSLTLHLSPFFVLTFRFRTLLAIQLA